MIDYNRKLSNERETQVPSHRMSILVLLETLIFTVILFGHFKALYGSHSQSQDGLYFPNFMYFSTYFPNFINI